MLTATGDLRVTLKHESGDIKKDETRLFSGSLLAGRGLGGGARCRLADSADCKVLVVGKDRVTGDFLADFQLPKVL